MAMWTEKAHEASTLHKKRLETMECWEWKKYLRTDGLAKIIIIIIIIIISFVELPFSHTTSPFQCKMK